MSILFLMPNWSGASELWMQRMIEALAPKLGAVACLDPAEPKWRGRVPAVKIGDDASLRAALRDFEITRVLAHYLPFGLRFENVWRETDVPLFVHAHGYDVTWLRHRPEPPHARQFDDEYPRRVVALSRRAVIIANSNTTAAKLRAIGVAEDRIVVKYLGVPGSAKPQAAEMKKGGGPLRILCLGRLIDFKGPDLTIRAFDAACHAGLDATLKIAGDGPLRTSCEGLRTQSRFADRIRLLGEVDEATGAKLRAEADVFTAHNQLGPITRQEEAFGVAIAEAMAAGIPVATGRSGSTPELIDDDVHGLLFPPGDVEAHAAALLKLRDPALRRRLGEAAWRRARERFSVEGERVALRDILRLE